MNNWRPIIAKLETLISICSARPQLKLELGAGISAATAAAQLHELESKAAEKLNSLCSQFARTGMLPESDATGSFFLLRRAIYARNFAATCMHPRNMSSISIANVEGVPEAEILEWLLIHVWERLGHRALAVEVAPKSSEQSRF
jgi:hypothetical protein